MTLGYRISGMRASTTPMVHALTNVLWGNLWLVSLPWSIAKPLSSKQTSHQGPLKFTSLTQQSYQAAESPTLLELTISTTSLFLALSVWCMMALHIGPIRHFFLKSHYPKSAYQAESFVGWRCCYVLLRQRTCWWVEGLKSLAGQSDQEVGTTHCQMLLWGGMWLLCYVIDILQRLQCGKCTTVYNHIGEAWQILPHWEQQERDFNHQYTSLQKS